MKKLPNPKYLSVQEAAQFLGISTKTLYRWEEGGLLIPERTTGNHRRYSLQKLEAFKNQKEKVQNKKRVGLETEKSFSIRQAANFLGTSPKTLRRWEKAGKIKSQRTDGGHRRYSLMNLESLKRRKFIRIPKPEVGIKPVDLKTVKEVVEQKIKEAVPLSKVIPLPQPAPQVSFSQSLPQLYQELHISQKQVLSAFLLVLGSTLILSLGVKVIQSNSLIEKYVIPNKLISKILGPRFVPEAGIEKGAVLADAALFEVPTFSVNVESVFRSDTSFEGDLALAGTLDVNGTGTHDLAGTLNLSGNTLSSTADLLLDPGGGGVKVGTGTPGTIDLAGDDLYVTGDLEVDGVLYGNGSGLTNLPASDAATLDSIDSGSFLRSDASDTFSSGTLTVGSSASLDITGTLKISGTAVTTTAAELNYLDGTTVTAGGVLFGNGTKITMDATNFYWDDTNDILKIGSGGSIIPSVDLGADLGDPSYYWNNLYVGTINSNSTLSTTGQALFTYDPADTTYTEASVIINPTAPETNEWMLGVGQGGYQRAGIDAEGDLVLGYNDAISIPSSSNPLEIYNHSDTKVFSIDTSGNLDSSSQTIDWALNGAIDALNIDSNTLSIDASSNFVGIGTNAPEVALHVDGSLLMDQDHAIYFEDASGNNTNIFYFASSSENLQIGQNVGQTISSIQFNTVSGYIFYLSGTRNFTIGSNLGIGNDSSPDAKLEILDTSEQLRLTHTDDTYDAHFTVDGSGNLALQSTAALYLQPNDDTGDYFTFSSDGTDLTLATTDSSHLTIDPAGNLIINTGTIDLSNQTVAVTLNDATDALNIDSNTLSIDAADNQVGIGTNNPAAGYSLDVAGYINTAQTVNQNTYPSVNASQTASTLQDGSANTGTDTTMSTQYIAVKFTASGDHTMGDYTIRVKEDTDITNTTHYLSGYLYADDGGSPSKPTGSALATGRSIKFAALTSSYQNLSIGTQYTLTNATDYWLVLKYSTAPTGGSILLDSDVSSNMGATSTDGSSWTNTDAQLWYQIRGLTYYALSGTSTNSYGVYGSSTNSYGLYGWSTNYYGLYAGSTNGAGVYGWSGNNTGVNGASNNYIGVYGLSSSSTGVYGASTSGIGVYGLSSSNYGIYGRSTSGIGVLGRSDSNTSGYFYRDSNTAAAPNVDIFTDHTGDTETVLKIRGDGTGDLINVFDDSDANEVFTIEDGGDVGIGDSSPDALLDAEADTEQLRLTYKSDATNDYASFTVDNNGHLTIDPTGNLVINTGTIDLSNQTVGVTLNAAANALNFDSNTLVIDADDNSVGIGTTTSTDFKLQVEGDIGPNSAPTITTASSNTLTSLDTDNNIGNYSSLAIGHDGLPIIAFYDDSNDDLRVCKCADAACTSGTCTSLEGDDSVGYTASIGIGSDGLPIISHYDTTNDNLRYCKCSNSSCTSASCDVLDSTTGSGYFTSLAIGPDDLPVVSHYDTASDNLRVCKCADTSCSSASCTTVDTTNDTGQYTSIAIGTDGLPIISFYYVTGGDLRVCKCVDSACSSAATCTSIDTGNDVGKFSSIAIPPDGLPIISHKDDTADDLRVCKCANTSCTSATCTSIDTTNEVGVGTSIAIGTDGLPVISYEYATSHDLKACKCLNSSCTAASCSSLDTDDVGYWTSIGIGTDGRPIISYFDNGTADLKVAKCASESCQYTSTGAYYAGGSDLGSLGKYFNNVFAVNYWVKEGLQVNAFDLAERYPSLETLYPGEVVSLDPENYLHVKRSESEYDTNLIGIVSSNPGLVLGQEDPFTDQPTPPTYPIALAGRVPVKIAPDSPEIKVGDYLTSSSTPGRATKATRPGPVVARALENWSPTSPRDTITAFLAADSYFLPNLSLSSGGDLEVPESLVGSSSAESSLAETEASENTSEDDLISSPSASEAISQPEEELDQPSLKDLSAKVDLLEGELSLIKANLLSSQGDLDLSQTDFSLTSLTVLGETVLGDTVVSGDLTVGALLLSSLDNSINGIGSLKIQSLTLGEIQIMGGKIEIDQSGNLNIKEGVVLGNENFRGSVNIEPGQKSVLVKKDWEGVPASITLTPDFNTNVWISEKSEKGFRINLEKAPLEKATVDWLAVW